MDCQRDSCLDLAKDKSVRFNPERISVGRGFGGNRQREVVGDDVNTVVDGKDVSTLRLPTKESDFLHGFVEVMDNIKGNRKDRTT